MTGNKKKSDSHSPFNFKEHKNKEMTSATFGGTNKPKFTVVYDLDQTIWFEDSEGKITRRPGLATHLQALHMAGATFAVFTAGKASRAERGAQLIHSCIRSFLLDGEHEPRHQFSSHDCVFQINLIHASTLQKQFLSRLEKKVRKFNACEVSLERQMLLKDFCLNEVRYLDFQKSLLRIPDFDPSRTVLIEDTIENTVLDPDNRIIVPRYGGESKDNVMDVLTSRVLALIESGVDVRNADKDYFNLTKAQLKTQFLDEPEEKAVREYIKACGDLEFVVKRRSVAVSSVPSKKRHRVAQSQTGTLPFDEKSRSTRKKTKNVKQKVISK